VREKFKSKIFCAPGKAVEAVGGQGRCKLSNDEISHHKAHEGQTKPGPGTNGKQADGEGILTHLWTRWTVHPLSPEKQINQAGNRPSAAGRLDEMHETEVSLDIEFRFANPVYAAMSSAVAEGVADLMIEAFTRRVEQQLGHGAI
jgi:coenzyme Q-binding protein COQ10